MKVILNAFCFQKFPQCAGVDTNSHIFRRLSINLGAKVTKALIIRFIKVANWACATPFRLHGPTCMKMIQTGSLNHIYREFWMQSLMAHNKFWLKYLHIWYIIKMLCKGISKAIGLSQNLRCKEKCQDTLKIILVVLALNIFCLCLNLTEKPVLNQFIWFK